MDLIKKNFETLISEYDAKFESYDKFKSSFTHKFNNLEAKL